MFLRFCYMVTVLATIAAALVLAVSLTAPAVQQAALAAFAIGLAVIPYVFTRMIEADYLAVAAKRARGSVPAN